MNRVLRTVTVLAIVAAGLCGHPRSARGQPVPAAYGLIGGTVAGIYVTTGVFVTKARAGSFIYSLEDALAVRWELIPLVVMPVSSFAVGLDDGQRLASSIKWGGAGFAAGAAVGLGVGTLLRQDGGGSESQWAGAIIGSAAGLLAGSIYGMLAYEDEVEEGGEEGGAFPGFTVRIPF